MRLRGAFALTGVIAVAASCGGAFSAAPPGDDGGADGGSTIDAPADALGDTLEEPPAHCTGAFTCVPGIPTGWTGPLEFYTGTGAAPPCTSNFSGSPFDGNEGLSASTATCGCACDTAKGVQCSSPTLAFFTGLPCNLATYCTDVMLAPGVCTGVDESAKCMAAVGGPFAGAAESPAIGGSCAPLPTKTVPGPTWNRQARACTSAIAPAQVDCSPGSVCAPTPGPPFGTRLCVSRAGDVSCPPGAYTVKQVFYGGLADTRDCSPCTCGDVVGATCKATLSVFASNDTMCMNGGIAYPTPFSCDAVQDPAYMRMDVGPQSRGSCTANPVAPTGSATPTQPMTFCCEP